MCVFLPIKDLWGHDKIQKNVFVLRLRKPGSIAVAVSPEDGIAPALGARGTESMGEMDNCFTTHRKEE
jgi:hypothetical protein